MPLQDFGDLDWRAAAEWLRDLDWGSVPAYAAAASLLLAFRLFLRDRRNAERAQVDLVGVWGMWERTALPEDLADRPYDVTVRVFIRNASELPSKSCQSHSRFRRSGSPRKA